MKILQLVPYFYPAWSYGGPAKLVYDTSVYYAQKGHSVTVYTSDAYDKQTRLPQSLHVSVKNLNVKYFKNFNNFLTYTYNIFFTPGLFITALREVKKFDIIHIHDFYTLQNFWVGFLARIFKIPYVLSVHGCLEDERVKQRSLFKQFFYKLYGRQLLLHASKVVATSKNEAKAYKQHGIHNSKIFILGHGIHPEEFITTKSKRECKKHFSIPSKNQVVTFLGRIHK
ncbi:MAG: glycosyltransferase, partial [Microgenomates group bacterium]